MPIMGLEAGSYFSSAFLYDGKYVGAILLFALGIWGMAMARRKNGNAQRIASNYSNKRIALIAFMLSLDNLILGFAFGSYNLPIPLVAATIAVISIVLLVIGLEVGRQLGRYVARWQDVMLGIILILLGFFILLT